MNTIFTTDDPADYVDKLNLDELFAKKQLHDLATTKNYKTILNRIHNKIKLTSRQQIDDHYCWFIVPEVMIGVPKFDIATCIAYVIDKLQENGFLVRYTHPNLLLISWGHWVPDYVRSEIKKKMGVVVDGFGNVQKEKEEEQDVTPDKLLIKNKQVNNITNNKSKSITEYKPTGKLIYNNDLLAALKGSK